MRMKEKRDVIDDRDDRDGSDGGGCPKPLSDMCLKELWQLFPIFLTEHRDVWEQWYKEEKERLCSILPMEDICAVSHVGSTSVPSIWAKPIVDILVEMKEGGDLRSMKERIIDCGYLCMVDKEGRISFNRGYTPEGFAERVFHLHLRTAGDNDELYFRDYLRENPGAAREYEALKLKLWKEYEHDRDGYTQRKADMVAKYTGEAKILYGGRYDRRPVEFYRAKSEETEEMRRLARDSEAHWGYDESFMEKFDRSFNITDSFIRDNPVFSAGEGGCLAAFWGMIQEEDGWELEYFYVSESILGKGLGQKMWKHMTGWCMDQGIKQFCFVTSPQAAGFYEKMGAVRDGERKSMMDGRPIPHFVYNV